MYNLHCCKDDANSLKKESALKTLKNAIASSEMTKKFSGHLQNVSLMEKVVLLIAVILLFIPRPNGGLIHVQYMQFLRSEVYQWQSWTVLSDFVCLSFIRFTIGSMQINISTFEFRYFQ